MRILLVGEYSRLHNSLKEGLIALGHEVAIVSSGDGLKQFDSDYLIHSKIKNNALLRLLNNLSIRLFNKNFVKTEYGNQFKKLLPVLKDYDVVQLINEDAIGATAKQSISILKTLFKNNKKVYLLCCGEDFTTINYFLNASNGYSVLTPYLENKQLEKQYAFSLKYTTKDYKRLHEFIYKQCDGIITSDIDYHRAFIDNPKYLGLIPNPINTDILEFKPLKVTNKIHVFHGINSTSGIKKGATFISKALQIIESKYPNSVIVSTTIDLPYKDYIKTYNDAHVFIDQVYSYDQGYNALEAMAKGKVVLTGAEQDWLDYYKIEKNTVAINALPDVDDLVKKLEWLINNPEQIEAISKNAHAFVNQFHDYKVIAKKYLNTWEVS